jgi:hypothetical protein
MAKPRDSAPPSSARPKRKNMLIDQDKLDTARAVLGALTETETVDAAFDLVVFRTEVFGALDHVAAAGGIAAPARNRRGR